MKREVLGEFEELVLTLVLYLKEEAYGAGIAEVLESRLRRDVNLSAIHVTLYRLEDKGYLKSGFGGATNERGGRRKRLYTVTNSGIVLLRSMQQSRVALWNVIPQLKLS